MNERNSSPLDYQRSPDRDRDKRPFAPTWLLVYLALGIGFVLWDMVAPQCSSYRRRSRPAPTSSPTVPISSSVK